MSQLTIAHKTAIRQALTTASAVVPFFEKAYPKDKRPRRAIEAGRAWLRGTMSVGDVRKAAFAAHAAARKAKSPAARAAARAAGQAASTVHVLGHAQHALDYVAKARKFVRQKSTPKN